MMNLDRFQYNFVNADSGKEYQDAYANEHKLKSEFRKWLNEEMVADTGLVRYQQTWNKSYMGSEVVPIDAWNIHDWFNNSVRG